MGCVAGEKNAEYEYRVELLDDTALNVAVKSLACGQDLLNIVFDHLNLVERDYFGLRYLDDLKTSHWLDLQKKVKRQIKKRQAAPIFYFGVKFYAADPCKLHEEITRYHYFLQIRRDVAQGRIPLSIDTCTELCALVVQAELGDYEERRHTPGYVSEFWLTPNQSEELESAVAAAHQKLRGLKPSSAELRYLEKVKNQEMYGVDLHRVKNKERGELFMGLTPYGVVVYKQKAKIAKFSWPQIMDINFKQKGFCLRIRHNDNSENVHPFELQSTEACHHLWKCCVEHHSFFRLSEVKDERELSGKFFNLGSKYRYSGRTEWQALSEAPRRPPPLVRRRPSRRQEHRLREKLRQDDNEPSSDKGESQYPTPLAESGHGTVSATTSVSFPISGDSPRSVRSAPWFEQPQGGLFTSGKDSPRSVRSERIRFPGRTAPHRGYSGSESDSPRRHTYLKGLANGNGLEDPGASVRPKDLSHASFPRHKYSSRGPAARSAISNNRKNEEISVLAPDSYYLSETGGDHVTREGNLRYDRKKASVSSRNSNDKQHEQLKDTRFHSARDAEETQITAVTELRLGTNEKSRYSTPRSRGSVKSRDSYGYAMSDYWSSSVGSSAKRNTRSRLAARNSDAEARDPKTSERCRRKGSGETERSHASVLMLSHAPLVKLHSGSGSVYALSPGTYKTDDDRGNRLVTSSSLKVSDI